MGKGAGKGKKKGKKDKVQVIPGGLTAEEEKDRQSKAKKAFEYFKETKIEEKKFDTYRQEREQLNYFWIVEKKRLEDKKAELGVLESVKLVSTEAPVLNVFGEITKKVKEKQKIWEVFFDHKVLCVNSICEIITHPLVGCAVKTLIYF